jgi:hypothetical protein
MRSPTIAAAAAAAPVDETPIVGDTIVLSESKGAAAHVLSSETSNVVRAWRVIIQGTVTATGRDITIVAHEIHFEEHAKLITSSEDGRPNNPPKILPTSHDATYPNGAVGGNATSAGNVQLIAHVITGTVWVVAKGGQGGRGQDGANGTDCSGPKPPQPPATTDHNATLAKGLPGCKGGDAGPAGSPGVSGAGGMLAILTVNKLPAIHKELDGGAKIEAANPGEPGKGGPGGMGQALVRFVYYAHKGINKRVRIFVRRGPDGDSPLGDVRKAVEGPKGADGTFSAKQISDDEVAKACTTELMSGEFVSAFLMKRC